jgi:hypothetical protein
MGHPKKKNEFIFTVTSIEVSNFRLSNENDGNCRCWGWFKTLNEAKDAVKNNAADMHETNM